MDRLHSAKQVRSTRIRWPSDCTSEMALVTEGVTCVPRLASGAAAEPQSTGRGGLLSSPLGLNAGVGAGICKAGRRPGENITNGNESRKVMKAECRHEGEGRHEAHYITCERTASHHLMSGSTPQGDRVYVPNEEQYQPGNKGTFVQKE